MTVDSAKTLIDFLEDYNSHFAEVYAFYTKKQSKVIADDLVWLIDSLAEEEKFVMKSNSLETRRCELFHHLGYDGLSSAQIEERAPEDTRGKLRLELENLKKLVGGIKTVNGDILEVIEKKLAANDAIVKKTGLAPVQTYNTKGKKVKITGDSGGFIGSL